MDSQELQLDPSMKDKIEQLIRYSLTEMKRQKFLSLSDISCPVREVTGNQIDLVYYRVIRLLALRDSLGSRLSASLLYQAGYRVAKQVNCDSYERLNDSLNEFLVGKINVLETKDDRVIIEEDECATCSGLPNIGETICDFESGFIAGSLECIIGKQVTVKETKCWGLGDRICRFEAEISELDVGDPGQISEDDPIELIAVLAGKASRAIDLAQELEQLNNKYRQDLDMARTVQMSLLPNSLPVIPGLDIDAQYIPANQLGGDFYDVFHLGEGKLGVVIADVVGHGTASALLTASFKGIIGRLGDLYHQPGLFLTQLNREMFSLLNRNDTVNFITSIYCVVEVDQGIVTLANAGHPQPVICKQDNRISKLTTAGKGGLPLGIWEDHQYQDEQFIVDPGDIILLYTDGLLEAKNNNNEQVDENQLFDLILRYKQRSAKEINTLLLEWVYGYVQKDLDDDVNTVLMKFVKER